MREILEGEVLYIKTKSGNSFKWEVEEVCDRPTGTTLKIRYQDLITEVRADKCFEHFGTAHYYETIEVEYPDTPMLTSFGSLEN
jgi:hypothetical protein